MYLSTIVEADLGVSGNEAWQVLKDFGGHYQFNPLIQLSPITNGITDGLGAEREIVLYDGSSMRQIILDYVEGESLLIGFTETDLPIKNATAKFTIEPPDQPFCRVSIEITYEPKFGFVGGLMGVFYQPTIRNRYNLVLRGLKHFVSTGQAVERDLV
jgi:hypothetical protein